MSELLVCLSCFWVHRSQARAVQAVAEATPPVASGDIAVDPASLQVNILSVDQAPPGVPSQAVISVPGQVDAAAVRAALESSENVLGVLQNRIVAITQTTSECQGA